MIDVQASTDTWWREVAAFLAANPQYKAHASLQGDVLTLHVPDQQAPAILAVMRREVAAAHRRIRRGADPAAERVRALARICDAIAAG